MNFKCKYPTPDGFDDLWMCSDGAVLTGLWFDGPRARAEQRPGCG